MRSPPSTVTRRHRALSIVAAALTILLSACRGPAEIVVFHAPSLSAALGDLAELFQKDHPTLRVRLEPSGSQVAARKVSELGLRADLVAVADASILDRMLIPAHAAVAVTFATNELVLAHRDHSRFTDEVTTENWPAVLVRDGVRLGRVDPDLAPLGYHTLFAWQLAETRPGAEPGLAERLKARVPAAQVMPDESELVALLESRAVDYAFLYRSTAEDHHLKLTALAPEESLGSLALAPTYARVHVDVKAKSAEPRVRLAGAPIAYGLAVLSNAPNPKGAALFVRTLLGVEGSRVLERRGFRPLAPARCPRPELLPKDLRGLVTGGLP